MTPETPTLARPTLAAVRRLAGLAPESGRVVSAYLSLDPARLSTPAARRSQAVSLFDEAAASLEGIPDLSRPEREAARRDLAALGERMRDAWDLPAEDAGGIAGYRCEALGLFELMPLPIRPRPQIVIAERPWLSPLAPLLAHRTWCIVLVNRRFGRLLVGSAEGLEEVSAFTDPVHSQHAAGGESQARFARSVEKSVADHIRHTADACHELARARRFDHVIVLAAQELLPAFLEALHESVRARVRATPDLNLQEASAAEVLEVVRPLILEYRRASVREALARAEEALAAGGTAAAGPEAVLAALEERRVGVLLLADGNVASERALHLALAGAADVLVADAADLERHGGMLALLRF